MHIPPQGKRIWGWWFFDWANQPYNTLILTFVFAPYFAASVAPDPATGQTMWGWTLALTGVCIAALAPVLGAIADSAGPKRPWIVLWSVVYVVGAALLWFAVPGADPVIWVLLAFAVGMFGLEFGIIFVNSILPSLGNRAELGRISGSGWGFGYLGGMLSLVIVLLFLAENEDGTTLLGIEPLLGFDPDAREGTRAVGPFTALWYLVFVIPFFLWVPEPAPQPRAEGAIRRGLGELWTTIRSLPHRPSLFAYLGGSMFYREGLNGVFAFGGIYAAGVLGWSITQIGVFGITAALTGAVFAWIGGRADSAFGPKPVIITGVLALIAVCLLVVTTSRDMVLLVPVEAGSMLPDVMFFLCGGIIGAAGASLQAASRTMMVRQGNEARMTEGFGLYALSGKATSFVAPGLVALATQITGDQRLGVAPLILLFSVGLVLMYWVRPEGSVRGEA